LRKIGSPVSGDLDLLFWYGLAGLIGVFATAVSLARRRHRWTRTSVAGLWALLFFSGLLTDFYLRHEPPVFRPAPEGNLLYLRGASYHSLTSDQEPFYLTDPLSYCPLQERIEGIDEPAVREWFGRYSEICEARR
jgi:hypothetical protein